MSLYKLSPKYKKSAVEVTYWTKDNVTVVYREGYRGGTFYCESDTRPNIQLESNDELNIGWSDCGTADCWEMEEMWDGCWGGWEFPDDMAQEERERIEKLWEEDSYSAMEEDGWYNSDTDYIFEGPLSMTCDGVELQDEPSDENMNIDLDDGLSAINEQDPVELEHKPSKAWPFPTGTWPFPTNPDTSK